MKLKVITGLDISENLEIFSPAEEMFGFGARVLKNLILKKVVTFRDVHP